MAFRPYLAFAGNAREAFTRYQQIFGGELVLLDMASVPPEAGPPPDGTPADAIMHAALTTPDDALLMGSDGPVDGTASNNICVNVSLADPPAAREGVRRARRGRLGAAADDRDVLLARVRDVHRPLRHPVDGHGRPADGVLTTTRPIVSRCGHRFERGGQLLERDLSVDDGTDLAALEQREQLVVHLDTVGVRREVEPAGHRLERDRVVDVGVADADEREVPEEHRAAARCPRPPARCRTRSRRAGAGR